VGNTRLVGSLLSRKSGKSQPGSLNRNHPALSARISTHLSQGIALSNTKRRFRKLFQLSLVVSYSDASASSPGFAVTDSILLGSKAGILKQERELVIVSGPK
jgi:hypothetical protein